MVQVNDIQFRVATPNDVFALMALFQIATSDETRDSVFLSAKKLEESILSPQSAWIVGERGGQIVAVASILMDLENRLGKINRLYVNPQIQDVHRVMKEGLPQLLGYLRSEKRGVEVVYTTAKAFTLKQQEATLDMGFKLIGVLPMAAGPEASKLNGLAAYFADGVLEKRCTDMVLHPMVVPFYDLVSRECGLPPLSVSDRTEFAVIDFEKLPPLELIHAPLFVAKRFAALEERRSLAMHFYPFTRPNALILDPAEKLEIYVKIMPDSHMATIIGERLELAVNPSELYSRVSRMLTEQGVTYIEVINDAADVWGIDCFVKAGFLPCAYFPCLKAQGDKRRDYVVLARSSERLFSDSPFPIQVNKVYLEYLAEYYKLEGREYMSHFIPEAIQRPALENAPDLRVH